MGLIEYVGFYRQLIAGSTASLGVLACSGVFAWITPILPHLLSPDSEIPMTPDAASWMVIMAEFGNLISALPAAYLADRIGRKIVILSSAPMFLIGWILVLYFKTVAALDIARCIQGLAVGIVYTVVPTYLGEIASPKYRGVVSSTFYILWWFGFLLEYILGPVLSLNSFTIVTASSSVIFFIAFIWQPESPYYYLMKNDLNSARKSLMWLQGSTEEETDQQLESMRLHVEEDQQKKTTWYELVATPVNRKALTFLFIVGILRQFCGLIPLSVFSTQTLSQTKTHLFMSAKNVTIVMGALMLIGTLVGTFTIDKFGRRPILFISCLISGIAMFCTGTFYYLQAHSQVDVSGYGWVPPVSLLVLSAVSVIGIFPVNTAYTSELFTSSTRGTASSVFSIFTTVIGIFCLKYYLNFYYTFGAYLNFYIFTAVCIFGTVVSYTTLPETKGKSFEQIRIELERN